MLVIKVYATKEVPVRLGESVEKGVKSHVDLELIDEIHIQNVGQRGLDNWEYQIVKPKGIKARISHFRATGYRPLLIKALGLLDNRPKKRKRRKKGG